MKIELLVLAFIGLYVGQAECVFGLIGYNQSIAVIGRLFCKGNYTTKGWLVQLYERDMADPDDKMGEVLSQEHGSFYVEGSETEITPIDPEVRIHHKCNGQEQCFKFDVPDNYTTEGVHPKHIYDAGIIHLDKKASNC